MNRVIRSILEALRDRRENAQTRQLAAHLLEKEDRLAARRAARAAQPAPEKKPVASVKHHQKARRVEERAVEAVSIEVWFAVRDRTRIDHRGQACCEACHKPRPLEPHHLEMGHGNRTDAPHLVMALCADCHRLGQRAAHRAVRWFAVNVVIPWATAHGYPLPNRKEYRTP